MFTLRAMKARDNENSREDREFSLCFWTFGSACRIGTTAGYNALGYALLRSSSYVTPALTMGSVVTSGAVGAAVLSGIALLLAPCRIESDPVLDFCCGPCNETLDVVISSLIGASINGLFVNNISTPNAIATISAAGAATATSALLATIIVVGGVYYCIAELDDDSIVFIPCNTIKKFSCKDLVKPCSLGLSICNRQQMLDLLSKCPRICTSSSKPATQKPQMETMTRDGYDTDVQNPDPNLYIRRDQVPVALTVEESQPAASTNVPVHAEGIEMVTAQIVEGGTTLNSASSKLTMV